MYFAKNSENQAKPKQVTETWDAAGTERCLCVVCVCVYVPLL